MTPNEIEITGSQEFLTILTNHEHRGERFLLLADLCRERGSDRLAELFELVNVPQSIAGNRVWLDVRSERLFWEGSIQPGEKDGIHTFDFWLYRQPEVEGEGGIVLYTAHQSVYPLEHFNFENDKSVYSWEDWEYCSAIGTLAEQWQAEKRVALEEGFPDLNQFTERTGDA